jgi:hypothetical protein
VITDQRSLRGASARFGVLELREPHPQNLPRRHLAVTVFFDEYELLRIGLPAGTTIFPPAFNWWISGGGMRSGAAVTITLSNGACSDQP